MAKHLNKNSSPIPTRNEELFLIKQGYTLIAGLDEVYDKIASALYLTKRRERYKALMDRLYTNADIYINETLLVGE